MSQEKDKSHQDGQKNEDPEIDFVFTQEVNNDINTTRFTL